MIDLKSYSSFEPILNHFEKFDFQDYLDRVSDKDIINSLNKDSLDEFDFLNAVEKCKMDYEGQI